MKTLAGAQIFGVSPEIIGSRRRIKCLDLSPRLLLLYGLPRAQSGYERGRRQPDEKSYPWGEIMKAVSDAVDIPVTAKIRKGWDRIA